MGACGYVSESWSNIKFFYGGKEEQLGPNGDRVPNQSSCIRSKVNGETRFTFYGSVGSTDMRVTTDDIYTERN